MSSRHLDISDPGGHPSAHFVCWGEVLWDIFPDARMLGGAPANVAYHLAQLGERVSLASRVGDDLNGHEARAALAAHGVAVDTVQLDPQRATGRVEVSFEAPGPSSRGEPSYQLVPGCAWEHIEVSPAVERALPGAAAFCYGTLSQRTSNRGFQRALSLLPEQCLRVCDVNLRPGHLDREALHEALVAADVVKVNEWEATVIAEHYAVGDPVRWLLADMGARVVALTCGAEGCRLLGADEPGGVVHGGFPAEPGGDNVGAGDGFTAVLTKFLVAGRPLAEIAEAGNRYGAYIASRLGATPAIDAELRAAVSLSGPC